MDVYAIVFTIIAVCCLVFAVVFLFKYHSNNKLCATGYGLLVGFLYCAVMAFCFANTNRCVECRSVVNTVFCTQCGNRNDDYIEPVEKIETGLICPTCKVECHTPYCGQCGSEIMFIEIDQ